MRTEPGSFIVHSDKTRSNGYEPEYKSFWLNIKHQFCTIGVTERWQKLSEMYTLLGDQKSPKCNTEQPALVSLLEQSGWTWWPPEVLSHINYSRITLFWHYETLRFFIKYCIIETPCFCFCVANVQGILGFALGTENFLTCYSNTCLPFKIKEITLFSWETCKFI